MQFCNVTGRSLCFTMVAQKKRLLRLPDSFCPFSLVTKRTWLVHWIKNAETWLHFSGRNLSLLIRANLFGERNSAHSDISAPLAWPLAFIHPKLCLRQSKLQQSVLLQWKHFKVLTWPSFTFHVQLTATQTQEKTKFSSQLTLTMPASEVLQLEHVPRSN